MWGDALAYDAESAMMWGDAYDASYYEASTMRGDAYAMIRGDAYDAESSMMWGDAYDTIKHLRWEVMSFHIMLPHTKMAFHCEIWGSPGSGYHARSVTYALSKL